jgi:MFS family permease
VTLLLFALYGVAFALTEGSGRAIIGDLVPPEARGRAFAAYYTFTGIAVIMGGYGLGRISDVFTAGPAFRLSAFGIIGMTALFYAVSSPSRQRNPK